MQGAGVTCPRPLHPHPCLGPFTTSGSVSAASRPRHAYAVLLGCSSRTQEPYKPSELLEAAELALLGHTLPRLRLHMPPSWVLT